MPAPFKNHTDEELELIEALVGAFRRLSCPGTPTPPRAAPNT